LTAPTDEQIMTAIRQKRGADAAFFSVVTNQHAEDTASPDLRELRTMADAYTAASRHAGDAVVLLRDLDDLDRHLTNGALDAETYAHLLDDRYRGVGIETWLAAAGVARLVTRLLARRGCREHLHGRGANHG
jgi:hypothetical protein